MKRIALLIAFAGLVFSCNELSSPPPFRDTSYLDSLGVWRDSTAGLIQDSLGIWRSTDKDSLLPFRDMPLAYRDFWRYCANCHSSSGRSSQAPKARRALRLNTWKEILAYGPEKLVLAAKGGGMPRSPSPPVSDEVLTRVQAFLASWPDTIQPIRIRGYRYQEAETFVQKYCAACHTPGGRSAEQREAALHLMLDDYEGWRKHQKSIRYRLDRSNLDNLQPMPPQDSPQDSLLGQNPADRARMLAWIDRFSPNTSDGTGRGDTVSADTAVKGLKYQPAFRIINLHCGACHSEGGLNLRQLDGWTALPFDTYGQWKGTSKSVINRRLDTAIAAQSGVEQMPPPGYFNVLGLQISPAERDTLLDWLERGSPNSVNGM